MLRVYESEPAGFDTVSVTSYIPGVLYCTDGFCEVEVDGEPPGKSQVQVSGSPPQVRSLKFTVEPVQT